MNILFIDNQGINEEELKYLKDKVPRQLEGNKQYILFLARNINKLHNIFFTFQKKEADIVHVFNGFSKPIFFRKKMPTVYSLLQSPIKKVNVLKKLPLLISERAGLEMIKLSILGLVPQSWFCRFMKKFDIVLTVSEYERDFLLKNNLDENEVIRIGIGVDHKFFKPSKKKKVADEGVTVSYFGAVSPFKGIDVVYKAVKYFNKNVKFRLALDLYEERHSNIARKLKKFRNVQIFGHIRNIKDFLDESDVIFLPFTTMLGSFSIPITLLESMSMGKIVLTTNLPPLKEMIKENKTGFLSDVKNIIKKLEWILENINSLSHIGKRARRFIVKNCDWWDVAKKVVKIYEEII